MTDRGRPSKFTPETTKKLLDAIRAGNYYEAACAYAGISYNTFRRWIEQAEEEGEGPFWDFWESLKRAEGEAEARVVALWQKHIPDDWKAAERFLQKRYPERWGNVDRINANITHSGQQGLTVEVVYGRPPDEEDVKDGEEE